MKHYQKIQQLIMSQFQKINFSSQGLNFDILRICNEKYLRKSTANFKDRIS